MAARRANWQAHRLGKSADSFTLRRRELKIWIRRGIQIENRTERGLGGQIRNLSELYFSLSNARLAVLHNKNMRLGLDGKLKNPNVL